MKDRTEYWQVPPNAEMAKPMIEAAAQLIRAGKRVAFPTETVYGLGADARNTAAVDLIFAAKGRPADNPLIVHIAHRDQLRDVVAAVDPVSQRLIDTFWPGPLTLVLPVKQGAVSPRVTAGLPTVAVRMPAHPTALALIAAAGCPLAAPSANRSGRPSPTRAEHVRDDLDGRIEAILDAGPTGIGLESTVVEVADGIVHILRPGGITYEQLMECVNDKSVNDKCVNDKSVHDESVKVQSASAIPDSPKSPGMKYGHYSPQGKLTLVVGHYNHSLPQQPAEQVIAQVQQLIDQAQQAGERTGVLTCAESVLRFRADLVVPCGSWTHSEQMARQLYSALRSFDDAGITYIIAEAYDAPGIGVAVMNRLTKAAEQRIIRIPVTQ